METINDTDSIFEREATFSPRLSPDPGFQLTDNGKVVTRQGSHHSIGIFYLAQPLHISRKVTFKIGDISKESVVSALMGVWYHQNASEFNVMVGLSTCDDVVMRENFLHLMDGCSGYGRCRKPSLRMKIRASEGNEISIIRKSGNLLQMTVNGE